MESTRDAGVRSYLQNLTRNQLEADIDGCERFAARLAAERHPDAITRIQVANNDSRLAIAYETLNGAS